MKDDELEQVVKISISKILRIEPEKITLQSSFEDDLGADSLDMLEIVMTFEDNLDIEIPDADAEKIKTVKQAVQYLRKIVS